MFLFIEKTKPEMKKLAECVTPKWAVYWKSIGRLLCIPKGQLDILGEDYSGKVERCCNEMFAAWLDTDLNATWEKVLEAIESSDCK